MPQFAIRRRLDPGLTRAEVDASALQTLIDIEMCRADDVLGWPNPAPTFGWVRTYWQPGGIWGMCLYNAPSGEHIEEYHTSCGVPHDGFSAVEEHSSPSFSELTTGKTKVAAGTELFVAEVVLPAGVPVDHGLFRDISAFIGGAAGVRWEGNASQIVWVRSYWDAAEGRAIALYASPTPEAVAALTATVSGSGVIVHAPVVEIYPDEYHIAWSADRSD